MAEKGRVINLSDRALIMSPRTRGFKKLIILPDYAPGEGLPVGSVAVFDKDAHKINPVYLGQDVGCGMLLARIGNVENLEDSINVLAQRLLQNQDGLGSLGNGNHFITLYRAVESQTIYSGDYFVLIHSGSRDRGIVFYLQALEGEEYLEKQQEILDYARKNRQRLLEIVMDSFNSRVTEVIDRAHNFVEQQGSDIIYRKGAVKAKPGELSVIPSSMGGDAILVRATDKVGEIEYSLPHATGRRISRSEAKQQPFFLDDFPKGVYVPHFLYAENLNGELPPNYRSLDDVFERIAPYVAIEGRFSPKSSIMF